MARRRGRRRGRGSRKLPIISLGILGGQAALAYASAGQDLGGAVQEFVSYYTGLNTRTTGAVDFDAKRLLVGYAPWVVKRIVGSVARPRIRGLPISLS